MRRTCLPPPERERLLTHYRRSPEPDMRLRAHILLLLDAGHPWATISAVLFCSVSTIGRWKRRFESEGVDAVFGRPRGRKRSGVHIWASLVVRWVLTLSPTDFRFARSRWSCEAVAVVLRDDYRVRGGRGTVRVRLGAAGLGWRGAPPGPPPPGPGPGGQPPGVAGVGRETVRVRLGAAGLVWRRPRPVIRPEDLDRGAKLRALRALLRNLPAGETAVFMDEVDVNLNPKVGCLWMRKGQQAAVETPG